MSTSDAMLPPVVGSVGWSPGYVPETTAVPYGRCLIHGSWDTTRYMSCPVCSTQVPMFTVYTVPTVEPPEATCPVHGYYKGWACPTCLLAWEAQEDPRQDWRYKAGWYDGYEAGKRDAARP